LNSRSFADPPGFSPERRAEQLELEQEQKHPHIALINFWRRVNAIAQRGNQERHRFSLNLFEARLCAIALRLGRRKRKSDPPSSIDNTRDMDLRRSRLLRRIENLSRKLQRQFEAAAGIGASIDFNLFVADYRDGIYTQLFHWLPKWCKVRSIRKLFIVIVDETCKLACRGLDEMGYPDTTPAEIRPLIRRFLAYSRRGRIRFSVRDLSDPTPFTRLLIANFIVDSWAKQDRKQKGNNLNRSHNGEEFKIAHAA